jgi:heat shock protein beta
MHRLEDLSDEEKRKKDIGNTEYETLRDWLKKLLGDKITGVNTSARLKSSPAALVQSEYGMSPTMQRYMKAQMTSQVQNTLDSC